ncbi:response regulator transcription factor [Aureibacillus halotolerans]|uniref:AraC family two component transcriptional regulator n=1 Tax=Aureibacillus halotolerans TaxID=1508390 RepID=A0A4R6TV64_9BACI|nr:response regulator [Aureibacillus halotolerans]TDQ37660.1 AraC family two component transcriptional regulator [Aureibacillus halotolerans]
MKICIVEDETVIRAGIKKMIGSVERWHLVGEAQNGEEGLVLVSKKRPDIVITDIRMPKLNGIELLQQIRTIHNDALVILLTGYADFTYAQQAIKYGAMDYILKPCKAEDLITILQKAETILQERRSSRKRMEDLESIESEFRTWRKRQRLLDLLNGIDTHKYQLNEEDHLASSAYVTVLSIRVENDRRFDNEFTLLKEHLMSTLRPQELMMLEPSRSERLLVLGFQNTLNSRSIQQEVLLGIRGSKLQLLHCGIGLPERLPEGANASYNQSQMALKRTSSHKKCINYSDLYHQTHESPFRFYKLEEKLLKQIRETDMKSADQTMEEIKTALSKETDSNALQYLHDLHIRLQGEFHKVDTAHFKEHRVNDAMQLLQSVVHASVRSVEQHQRSHSSYVANRVLKLIHLHFHEDDLTLKKIARLVQMNASYLSTVFSKEHHQSFSDYLMAYRLGVAKEALEHSSRKIYDIAESVGYADSRHFSQVFKKNVGCSPVEYRRGANRS